MTNDAARLLAQEGLRHIEDAVLMLLEAHPQGLRNAQIADALVHSRRPAQLLDLFRFGRADGARGGSARPEHQSFYQNYATCCWNSPLRLGAMAP